MRPVKILIRPVESTFLTREIPYPSHRNPYVSRKKTNFY